MKGMMRQSFQRLCDEQRDRIYTFACYYLGNREDAEDATQDVLVRLWRNWQRLPGQPHGGQAMTLRQHHCLAPWEPCLLMRHT